MSDPKVVEILGAPQGHVVVCTEADGTRYSWTSTDDAILGGGTIFEGTEALDHKTYRRQGDQWKSYTPEGRVEKVSDQIARHLALVEQAAANYKSLGRVQ